jgi:hypothetical protein
MTQEQALEVLNDTGSEGWSVSGGGRRTRWNELSWLDSPPGAPLTKQERKELDRLTDELWRLHQLADPWTIGGSPAVAT